MDCVAVSPADLASLLDSVLVMVWAAVLGAHVLGFLVTELLAFVADRLRRRQLERESF